MSESDFTAQLKMLSGMPAAEFVLHREPMLLLDRLVDVGPEYAICEWQVCDKIRFFEAGLGVPAYVGVEYMAQCVAVHAGARARVQGLAPPLGFLLGTEVLVPSVAAVLGHPVIATGNVLAAIGMAVALRAWEVQARAAAEHAAARAH